MYRKFIETLQQWEKQNTKEPLMVVGARQVGKTWLIRKFCSETYLNYVYINFEENPSYVTAFDGSLSPETILQNLGILLGKKISAETAIFFDEIQICEKAITSLKYFCESETNYRVLCAGSLLGVKLNRFEKSFPVGKVSIRTLYPMDFEEFLIACEEEDLCEMIHEHYSIMKAMPDGIHQKALDLYHKYLFVGGMPRVVKEYIDNGKDVLSLDFELFNSLQSSYLADMAKHVQNPAESLKIIEVYNSIPRQLAKENPKFMYKEVRQTANKRDFQTSIDWLVASGLAYKVCDAVTIANPLKGYEDENKFKLYMLDTGILSNMCRLKFSDIVASENNIYKGIVIENYVISQLKTSGKFFCYYKPSDSIEIDVVLDTPMGIIPCEIKAGRHVRSKSLSNYCEKFLPKKAFRFSELNFGQSGILYSIPLYSVCFI